MFHKSNLGKFGDTLPCDRNGFVPEAGDWFGKFDFGGDLDADDFDDFLNDAIDATADAEVALAEWRAMAARD
jgi:hypothetical protein